MRTRTRLVFAVCFVFCLASFVHVGGAAAQGPLDCGKEEPTGWTVIPTASSAAAAQQFVCNYKVRHQNQQSGAAITIEYFCSATEAADRFKSVTDASRKTETKRVDGELLVIEEGPKAKNPDNPQSRGVFSTFFDVDFTLMEKEWRLLNPQVFATIVTLTNERGSVNETDRFGVTLAEPVSRSLANDNRSVMPCDIPLVKGITSKRKGKGPIVKIGVIAGALGVAVGGITVWRRRKLPFAPPAPPPLVAEGVPPTCSGLAQQFDTENAKLAVLQEAATDLRRQVDRAERIHKNNIIKAKLVVGIEIASALSGPALDLAIAMRRNYMQSIFHPAEGNPFGQLDNWKPPGSLSAKMAAALERAEAAAQSALSKFRGLAQQAEEMAASLAHIVDELPLVKQARENFTATRGRLRQIEEEFAQCEAFRGTWAKLTEASEANNREMIEWHGKVAAQANRVAELDSKLKQAQGKLGIRNILERDIAKLRADLAGEQNTLRLGELEYDLQDKMGQLSRMNAEPDVAKALSEVPGLESGLAGAQRDLEAMTNLSKPELDRLSAKSGEISRQRQEVSNKLYQNENRTRAHVEEQREILAKAGENAANVREAAWSQHAGELDAKQNAANAAGADYQGALSTLEDMRLEASVPLAPPSDPSVGAQVLSGVGSLLKFPFTVLGELVFGVGQSPEEIMEILRVGRTNVLVLHSHIDAVDIASDDQVELTDLLRRRLDACVKANSAKPVAAKDAP